MAIQFRHGTYGYFDKSKMVTGEPAVVQSGDPGTMSGKAVYVAYGPGDVDRFVTEAEVVHQVDAAFENAPHLHEVVAQATEDWLDDHPEATTTVEDDSITTIKIKGEAVTHDKIEDYCIDSTKIDHNAVTSWHIADGTITDDDLAGCNVTETATRANIAQGETRATIFGKIKKWFTDLAPLLVEESVSMSDADNPYGITVIQLRRKGKLVQIYFGGPCKNFTKAWTTVATIPTAFRPTYQVPYDTQIPQTSGTDQFLVSVLANGAFRIYPMTDNALNGAYINSTFWYFID